MGCIDPRTARARIALQTYLVYPCASFATAPATIGNSVCQQYSGEVSEWLKEHAWKVCIR